MRSQLGATLTQAYVYSHHGRDVRRNCFFGGLGGEQSHWFIERRAAGRYRQSLVGNFFETLFASRVGFHRAHSELRRFRRLASEARFVHRPALCVVLSGEGMSSDRQRECSHLSRPDAVAMIHAHDHFGELGLYSQPKPC